LQYRSAIDKENSKLGSFPEHSEDFSEHERRVYFGQLAKRVDDLADLGLRPHVKRLSTSINHGIFIFYIDEAHKLKQRYWALQRVLWTIQSKSTFWFSFMGTNTHLSEFVPKAADR
jgi:hypothetical protein